MKLTQEQAARLALAAAVAMGIDTAENIERQVRKMTAAERAQLVSFAEAVIADAIAQGLVAAV